MSWEFEKFKGDLSIYCICPQCKFKHNVSLVDDKLNITIDPDKVYNYCPICGEKHRGEGKYPEDVYIAWNSRSVEDLYDDEH